MYALNVFDGNSTISAASPRGERRTSHGSPVILPDLEAQLRPARTLKERSRGRVGSPAHRGLLRLEPARCVPLPEVVNLGAAPAAEREVGVSEIAVEFAERPRRARAQQRAPMRALELAEPTRLGE